VLHGLYWLVANLAERSPLLLAIDDAQWADGPSQRFLLHLSNRLDGLPVSVVLTTRSGESRRELNFLETLLLKADAIVLRPQALSPQAVAQIVQARLGGGPPPDLALACYEATRGNPFLLVELLEELGNQGRPLEEIDPVAVSRLASRRIAAAILFRVGRLGGSAPRFARSIAVLGETASVRQAAALAGLDRVAAGRLVDDLVEARVLERGRPLRFAHPIVRGAIYAEIPSGERAAMHARAARVLAAEGAEPEGIAPHLLATEPSGDARVVKDLRDAAGGALSRGAPETATRYLRRALDEPPPPTIRWELLLELGSAAARAGEADGLEMIREAFALAEQPRARAAAGLRLGAELAWLGAEIDEAVDVLERALEGLEDPELLIPLETMLLLAGMTTPTARTRAAPRFAQARSRIDALPAERVRPLCSPLAVDALVTDGDAAEAARLAERAVAGGALVREEFRSDIPLASPATWVLVQTDRLQAAERVAENAVLNARPGGSPVLLARASGLRAFVRYRMGSLRGAEADARNCLELAQEPGLLGSLAAAALVAVLVERAEPGEARATLQRIEARPYDPEVPPLQALRESRAALLMAEGDPQAAREELFACRRWEEVWEARAGVVPVPWRSAAALADAALGNRSEAMDLAGQEVELARRFGTRRAVGVALRAMGLVEGGGRGLDLLEEAVSVLEDSAARLEYARAVVDLGAALRRAGKRSAGVEMLREGMDRAHRCGASGLVHFAREELRLAGARPGRIARTGRDALTPAERRVADLAAEGMRNKEIAQGLFVTLRTVEMHLSNAYRKLEISSREDLADALGEP
jgi:DNA-binding CsgD family transcriptional regulator